mgnify:CR=1 FL=1
MLEGEATRIAVRYTPPPRRVVRAVTLETKKESHPLPRFYWYLLAAVLFVILLLKVLRCSP